MSSLVYPFDGVPQPGDAWPVAPGVLWIRMPLDLALTHVNLYALADGDGWTIVDTGMKSAAIAAAWERLLPTALENRPLARLIVTHMHPDHVGMAGWLAERAGCPLSMTPLEYLTARVFANDTSDAALDEHVRFYRRAGWNGAQLASLGELFFEYGRRVHALPERYARLSDGDVLRIGQNEWRIITGYGHSPEHACLYCPALKVFISGDQVLPKITSNVSVLPFEPGGDPLAAWIGSIEKLRAAVPDDVLVLPAHNEPFTGLHARLDSLAAGHARALERLLDKLGEPRRATDVFDALFARAVTNDPMILRFATGESLAHLNWLLLRGRASVDDRDGVAWYRRR